MESGVGKEKKKKNSTDRVLFALPGEEEPVEWHELEKRSVRMSNGEESCDEGKGRLLAGRRREAYLDERAGKRERGESSRGGSLVLTSLDTIGWDHVFKEPCDRKFNGGNRRTGRVPSVKGAFIMEERYFPTRGMAS